VLVKALQRVKLPYMNQVQTFPQVTEDSLQLLGSNADDLLDEDLILHFERLSCHFFSLFFLDPRC
jgi:hypothetical protein